MRDLEAIEAAAMLADELSAEVGIVARRIEIVAKLNGFEVRGEVQVGGLVHTHVHLISYRDFYGSPPLLERGVRITDRELRKDGRPGQ